MKKVLLVASIASALSLFNVAQAAGTGTITFNGTITDATCDVSVNGSGADATVTLPTISKSDLSSTTSGTVRAAGPKPFTLSLTNCSSTGKLKVQAYFKPDAGNISPTTGYLYNQAAGTAKDVQVRLKYGVDDAIIDVNNNLLATNDAHYVQFAPTAPATNGTATLPFVAEYVTANNGSYNKTGTAALSAGTVVAQVEYELQYD